MTAFNINGGAITKWDSLSGGSTNATKDTYTISAGSTLLIETDSYQCANHSTAFGSLDTVSFSGVGGKLKIDGSNVRVIPFNTGSGTVPAIGTTISRSGVSGTLLGVWSAWTTEPLAAAAAMPTTGFIKIKDKTGGTFSAGALTGISESATGADVVGWIEVRGSDSSVATIPRVGQFEVTGEWFSLGTTNGSRGQVLACPTCATNAGVIPGVMIETSAGSGVYEWYAAVGTRAATSTDPTDSTRGKVVWQTTSGIRIGSDGTNNVGYLPASGCDVRIGNVFLTTCTRTAGGSGARVLPNATVTTRYSFNTDNSGNVSFSKCVSQWYSRWRWPNDVALLDSAFADFVYITKQLTPMNINRCCVAPTQQQAVNGYAVFLENCFNGGTIADNYVTHHAPGSWSVTDIVDVDFLRNKSIGYNFRGSSSENVWNIFRDTDCVWTDNIVVGGRIHNNTSTRPQHTNTAFCDRFSGTNTDGSQSQNAFSLANATTGAVIDGITLPVGVLFPSNNMVDFENCYKCRVRNIGTFASPLDVGTGSTWTTQQMVNCRGGCSDIKIQRVYASNVRNQLIAASQTDIDVVAENCFGDYADVMPHGCVNALAKSCGGSVPFGGGYGNIGMHFAEAFDSTTSGRLVLMANEPSAETIASGEYVLNAGTPKFNGSTHILPITAGDQVTWTMQYFALGYTGFSATAISTWIVNSGNFTFEFQWDFGSGFNGSWISLTASNLNALGAIDPAVGFRLKIRMTVTASSATNEFSDLRIVMDTTSTAQSTNLYPLTTNTLTITGMVSGTRYRVEKVSDGSLIGQGTSTGGPDIVTHSLTATTSARIVIRKSSSAPKYQPLDQLVTLGDFASSVIVTQQPDTVAI